MKVALPIRNGRISPVFDVAVRLIVVEFDKDVPAERSEFSIRESGGEARAELLQDLGVTTLICGAISNQTARIIERCGIEIKPWIVGEIEDVINAFCTGSLNSDGFIMPGCGQGQGGGRGNRQGRRSGCRGENRGKAGPGNRRSNGGRRNRE
jgi:predicted Fe-Mo cluster-binding NifX family protein